MPALKALGMPIPIPSNRSPETGLHIEYPLEEHQFSLLINIQMFSSLHVRRRIRTRANTYQSKGIPMLRTFGCPQCSLQFTPRYSNQRYCSDPRRKNGTRGSRTAENKSRNSRHYERSRRFSETLYSIAPEYRLGVLREILDRALTDSVLRNILTDPALLSERLRADNRMNIQKLPVPTPRCSSVSPSRRT